MDDMRLDLSKVRLAQAQQCIASAKILAENNDYRGAANRSYYAIFHGTIYDGSIDTIQCFNTAHNPTSKDKTSHI